MQVAWGKPVLDRVGLIIEIFNAHAETKEAKLQVHSILISDQNVTLVRSFECMYMVLFDA